MSEYATTAPTQESATGLPEGVTVQKMSDAAAHDMEHRLYTEDELQGVAMTKMDAPNNSVFDQDSNRTLSLPQTLSETETGYLIKRDADKVKEFFGMQEVGGFEALGKGVASFVIAQPQAFATLGKEQSELAAAHKDKPLDVWGIVDNPLKLVGVARDKIMNSIDADEFTAKMDGIIERNRKYMADAGFERPEQGGLSGVMYDFGQGGSSLIASVGIAALTRSPTTAGLYFGALQKASVYQEARTAGKTPDEASDISTLAGTVEGALEFVGLDHFMKAIKGNSAVVRFINGAAIEGIQEGSQQAGEEAITQFSGVRKDKPLAQTAQDILYNAALGAILGGGSNVALGLGAKNDAKKAGMDDATAGKMGKYVEDNVESSKANMTEFIDKELAPIARDEQSAMEFMTLMQKFGNDQELVNRDSLSPEMRSVFDQYVDIFNKSTTDKTSVAEVEKNFYEGAVKNGVNEDQAVAASKIVGARADAASRALGVTPMEWFKAKNISVNASEDQQGIKGSATFMEDGVSIDMFSGSDNSTLFHELGHTFLRDMRDISKVTKRPRAKGDYSAVQKWLGAKGDALTVTQEEKFARGFEAYLREGKAPKPELQSVFDTFKKWLESIYKSVQQLNVNLSPEIRDVFDRMLGSDYAMSEKLNQDAAERSIEDEYSAIAAMKPEGTFLKDTGSVFRSVHDWSGDAFTPVSTRLGKIDEKLKHSVRRYMFNMGLYAHEDHVAVKPFIEKVSDTFSPEDYRVFDLALKNRDTVKVDFLAEKYGIQKEWQTVRDTLDAIHIEATDVGLDLNYIDDYFPRLIKRGMAVEYMAAMRGHEAWSEIEAAMKEADPENKFNAEEQAAFVNAYLRGFSSSRINLARPSFAKERTVDHVTPEFNRFYEDSMPTLIKYIGAMRQIIEARRLFGKSEKDTDVNIGKYVLGLVKDGVIKADEEMELKKILKAAVDPSGAHGFVGWLKNATYIYTMGSPLSAITQVQDLAFSAVDNGYFRTILSVSKSLTGNQILKKEDIGIDNILQEYEENTRASNAVRATFKAVGLTFMDNVGKETYIDAAYGRLKSAAKKGGKEFDAQMEIIFGDGANQVKKDLASGNMTEDVKYLLFSELSDVQPVSLAEMPVHYLNAGNWRVMYMLKTYTLKQFDIYRRKIFNEIASGDPARMIKGTKNLINLGVAMMFMGMGSDALKDLILGRDFEVSDLIIDNLLKLFGVSKYNIYKAKEEGIGNAIFRFLTPPILSPLDDLRDVKDIVAGKEDKRTGEVKFKDPKDAEVLQRIPVIGKFYYWWYGGGKAKTEKKTKVSSP